MVEHNDFQNQFIHVNNLLVFWILNPPKKIIVICHIFLLDVLDAIIGRLKYQNNSPFLNPFSNTSLFIHYRLSLVESIPVGLTYDPGSPSHPSTFSGLMNLMKEAKKSIEIASFYWTLNGSDIAFHDNSSWEVSHFVLYLLQCMDKFFVI